MSWLSRLALDRRHSRAGGAVIPGPPISGLPEIGIAREPGIHNHGLGLWIPARALGAPRNDDCVVGAGRTEKALTVR